MRKDYSMEYLLISTNMFLISCSTSGDYNFFDDFIWLFIIVFFLIFIRSISRSKKSKESRIDHDDNLVKTIYEENILNENEKPHIINITPDKIHFSFRKYSPNNYAEFVSYVNNEYRFNLHNDAINKFVNCRADTKDEIIELIEEIFRNWAKIEDNIKYTTKMDFTTINWSNVYEFTIKGIDHREDKERQRAEYVKKREKIILIRERNNSITENAIRVLSEDGFHIGYVSNQEKKYVSRRFDGIGYGWRNETYRDYGYLYLTGIIIKDRCKYNEIEDSYKYKIIDETIDIDV